MGKRLFDVVVALIGIAFLIPLFAVIALVIKLTSKGTVFYRGVRVGQYGRIFHIWKFRTMEMNADHVGGSSTPDDDPRITAEGRMLRRYKLDELPQLFNVLAGNMSLVGPRPQVPEDVAKYTEDEKQLLSVKPGITDFASIRFHNEGEIIKGHSDPDQAYIDFIRPEKLRLCLEYVRRRSFRTDISIIWMTLKRLAGFPVHLP